MSYLDHLKRETPPSRQISNLATVMEFGGDAPGCQSAEIRWQRVLAMLDEHPGTRYAVLVGSPAADTILLTLATRGEATCEHSIEAARFDPSELFSMLDRLGQPVH